MPALDLDPDAVHAGAECDLDAIVAWRNRVLEAAINQTLRFVASVLVPVIPAPIDLTELGITNADGSLIPLPANDSRGDSCPSSTQ